MKTKIILVVLICIFLQFYDLLAQEKVLGGFRTCMVYQYSYNKNILDTTSKKIYSTIKYDTNGNLIEKIDSRDKTLYKYDEYGNMIEETKMKSDGSIEYQYSHEYNKKNKVVSIYNRIPEKSKLTETYEYDEQDRLILRRINSILKIKYEYSLDSYKNLVENDIYMDSDSIKGLENIIIYNEKKQPSVMFSIERSGEIVGKRYYNYYDNGKMKECLDFSLEDKTLTKYNYIYDNFGNITELIMEKENRPYMKFEYIYSK